MKKYYFHFINNQINTNFLSQTSQMPLCGNQPGSDCAHEATRELNSLGIVNLKNAAGMYCCEVCKFPVRAHEVGKWASKYKSVNQCQQQGSYLVYQVRDVDDQGHVYVYHNGQYYGNQNYNWPQNNTKGGKITTKIYQLK